MIFILNPGRIGSGVYIGVKEEKMKDVVTLYLTDFKTGEKTAHTATGGQLRTGTIKRIFAAVDVDKILKDSKTTQDFIANLTGVMLASYPIFEAELLTIFPDVTKEDLDEKTTIEDVAVAITDLILYTFDGLAHIGDRIKKKMGLEA